MSIFIIAYDDGNCSEFKESLDFKMFANYNVTDSTIGYIASGDNDNSLGYLLLSNAVYGEGCFIITFDTNGETSAANSKAQTSKSEQLILLPNKPTHVDRYNFSDDTLHQMIDL